MKRLLDDEHLLDDAAMCSQNRELLRDDDDNEPPLRECVRLNVCNPLREQLDEAQAIIDEAVGLLRVWVDQARYVRGFEKLSSASSYFIAKHGKGDA